MELRDFVDKTIYDICMGIKDAAEKLHEETNSFPIAPSAINGKSVPDKMREIEFDICVNVMENKNKGAGGGASISVFSAEINLGGNAENQSRSETAQRIKFSVPFAPGALRNKGLK